MPNGSALVALTADLVGRFFCRCILLPGGGGTGRPLGLSLSLVVIDVPGSGVPDALPDVSHRVRLGWPACGGVLVRGRGLPSAWRTRPGHIWVGLRIGRVAGVEPAAGGLRLRARCRTMTACRALQ